MSLMVLVAAVLLNSVAVTLKHPTVRQATRPFSGVARVTAKLALGGNFNFGAFPPPYTELAVYEAGMSVNVVMGIVNNGAYGLFDCKIYDDDTGAYLVGFGDYLDAGAVKTYTTLVGTMPTRDWNLRLEVSP